VPAGTTLEKKSEMRRLNAKLIAPALAGLLVGSTMAGAQQPASPEEAIVKYRQLLMTSQGGHIGSIFAILQGKLDLSGHITGHAEALNNAAQMTPAAFPPGSGPESGIETRALPKIWETFADFTAKSDALQAAAANLLQVAQGGGDAAAIGAAAGQVGQACQACHDTYRAPKEE